MLFYSEVWIAVATRTNLHIRNENIMRFSGWQKLGLHIFSIIRQGYASREVASLGKMDNSFIKKRNYRSRNRVLFYENVCYLKHNRK